MTGTLTPAGSVTGRHIDLPLAGSVSHDYTMVTRRELGELHEAGISADDFKAAFRHHPGGVAIVTGDDGTGPVAMTVSSVFSVSAEPPALVFSLSDGSSATPHLLAAGSVVVHLLSPADVPLAKLAATHGSDRFGPDVTWDRLPTGEPYYPQVHTWLRGTIVDELQVGLSTVAVVHVVEAKLPPEHEDISPLIYHNRRWVEISDDSYITI
ncbi:MAG: flavin reductase family protein [Agromyces sp.]